MTQQTTVGLAEQILAVLEDGKFSATYKYAVYLALTDLCIEAGSLNGSTPAFTTRQLARRVIDIYWSHAREFSSAHGVLRQATGGAHRIVRLITTFKRRERIDDLVLPSMVDGRPSFHVLVDAVELKLIEDPIPRLQVLQGSPNEFLYHCAWLPNRDSRTARAIVGKENRLQLFPGVAEGLVRLNGVLRPLIEREWARRVARMNGFDEKDLLTFLFDSPRVSTAKLRDGLRDLQQGRCFFCHELLQRSVHVDHFIPRARYADDCVDNLVLSDATCNGAKRALLPARAHVQRWTERSAGGALEDIARNAKWPRNAARTKAVALSLYVNLPAGSRLWLAGGAGPSIDEERDAIATTLRQTPAVIA